MMPNTNTGQSDANDPSKKRNLPSWMNPKENSNKSERKKGGESSSSSGGSERSSNFSTLMEGVVFALSGFVNPERSTLRSQALEMGAQYRPDWSSDCTLLVCAFPNTPKFRQVQGENGTIVSKEWISECYDQKRLVDIERYLMHVGKPWRKSCKYSDAEGDQKNSQSEETQKRVQRRAPEKSPVSSSSKAGVCGTVKEQFSPSKVKEWAKDDLSSTISWLESQEEKPGDDEIKMIAAEGIMTCLQDAIEALEQSRDVRLVTEQWNFVPRVVKELAELDGKNNGKSLFKKELMELAMNCRKIYKGEFSHLDSSPPRNQQQKADLSGKVHSEVDSVIDDAGFDSDQTIEMTQEEIELACKHLSSEPC